MMSRGLLLVLSALLLAYPLFVFFGLQYLEPRYIGLILVTALLVRLVIVKVNMNAAALHSLLPETLAGGVCCLFIVVGNDPLMVRANPIFINGVLLILFAVSLCKPPSIIERVARLKNPDLPEQGIQYARKVTMVWCCFFVVNGLIAAYTTFYCSVEVWTLYNGLIAYLLMGLLFGVEYLVRLQVKRVA